LILLHFLTVSFLLKPVISSSMRTSQQQMGNRHLLHPHQAGCTVPVDLYDNSIVAYKTGTQQTVNLVLDTIRLAMR